MKFSTLVLVDDDPAHLILIERHLRRTGYSEEIIKLDNGLALLNWLDDHIENSSQSTQSPCIFLDINLPYTSGIQILDKIKKNTKTAHIPVIMVTTSDSHEEIDLCYQIGCNAYFVKPTLHESFKDIINDVGLFLKNMRPPRLHTI